MIRFKRCLAAALAGLCVTACAGAEGLEPNKVYVIDPSRASHSQRRRV